MKKNKLPTNSNVKKTDTHTLIKINYTDENKKAIS